MEKITLAEVMKAYYKVIQAELKQKPFKTIGTNNFKITICLN